MIERGFKCRASNIIEEYVPFIMAMMGDLGRNIFGFIIDNRVETGFLGQPAAFLFATGNTDNAAAFQLGNLPNNRTSGTGST